VRHNHAALKKGKEQRASLVWMVALKMLMSSYKESRGGGSAVRMEDTASGL
jgi:hypothetical protein